LQKLEYAKQVIDEAQKLAQDKQIRDNTLHSEISSLKNQILDDIRKNYFNLFTCAYSQPLVIEDSKQGIVPVKDVIKSMFDLRMTLSRFLEETGKQF